MARSLTSRRRDSHPETASSSPNTRLHFINDITSRIYQTKATMLYELIGVVRLPSPICITTGLINPPGSPIQKRQRNQRVSPSITQHIHTHVNKLLTLPQNNQNHWLPRPPLRRRCPRHHQLGNLPPSQTHPQTRRCLVPPRPVFHLAV